MLTQVWYNMRMMMRNTGIVIWAFAFPIIMATIFMTMFSNVGSELGAHRIAVGVVESEGWEQAGALRATLEALGGTADEAQVEDEPAANTNPNSEDDAPVSDVATAKDASADAANGNSANGDTASPEPDNSDTANPESDAAVSVALDITVYHTEADAQRATLADDVCGFITVDDAGAPTLHVSPVNAGTTNQTIVQAIIDQSLAVSGTLTAAAEHDPALANPNSLATLSTLLTGSNAQTTELSVLREPPQQMSRFYYALLGYSCIMCSNIAQILIDRTRIAVTPAGTRRQASALQPARQLGAALAASWIIAWASMLVAVGYLWLVAGVSFGGRIWLAPLACAVCALVSCALGAFIGALPGANPNVKDALITIATLVLSLPAGLFGEPAIVFGNFLTQHYPVLQSINPAVQATESLFALTYYDSLEPFAASVATLAGIALALGAGAALFMRRQRHAYC